MNDPNFNQGNEVYKKVLAGTGGALLGSQIGTLLVAVIEGVGNTDLNQSARVPSTASSLPCLRWLLATTSGRLEG